MTRDSEARSFTPVLQVRRESERHEQTHVVTETKTLENKSKDTEGLRGGGVGEVEHPGVLDCFDL